MIQGVGMVWKTLGSIWHSSGKKNHLQVRFNDWNYGIKYFEVLGESEDGKRLVGKLDNGEKVSYPKRSRGWSLYHQDSELQARAV
jgi:hypothetical protein